MEAVGVKVYTGKCILGLGFALLAGSPVPAADSVKVLFLHAPKPPARAGDSITLQVLRGSASDAVAAPISANQVRWLFVRTSGTQKNFEPAEIARAVGAGGAIVAATGPERVSVVGIDLKPVVVPVSGRELKSFLNTRTALGLETGGTRGINANRTYRVRRIESATTLVRVPGSDAAPSAVAQGKTGQAVEIRPLADPTSIRVGGDLPIRVYIGGAKRAGARVLATEMIVGTTHEVLTDAAGTAAFTITSAGPWRIEFHHAEPLARDSGADWVIYSATLTFEVPK